MPTSVVPSSVPPPDRPQPGEPEDESRNESRNNEPQNGGDSSPAVRGSRWIDYDTHELLEMISELEDERRWARLREGILWAVLFHILLISALTWIPRYIFKVPPVISPFDALKERKDLKYLDLPPDLLRKYQSKVAIKPVAPKQPQIDRKTLEALQKEEAERPKVQPQQTPPPPPPPQQSKVEQPPLPQPAAPKPEPPAAPSPQPSAVPRHAFDMGSQNPSDQLQQAMRGAAGQRGYNVPSLPGGEGLAQHPGAGTGGVQILSDTQGVDFNDWLIRWHYVTQQTWDPLIPDEVNPPILKAGVVVIRFKVLPNGQVIDMQLVGRSGDTGLDRAAWGAIRGSSYPPLPRAFHGPYLELQAYFLYNQRQQ
jgi:TonB family protein